MSKGQATQSVPISLDVARGFASLSREQKRTFIAQLSDAEALQLTYMWEAWARDKQLEPPGYWLTWLVLTGRGFGKTRTGTEYIRSQIEQGKMRRVALVARTAADVRDVLVEGQSGILSISPPWFKPKYEPSKRRLTWPNGSVATTYSAEEPDLLRGPEHDGALCDERAAWKYEETWSNLMLGLRVGEMPRCVVMTTPRPTKAIKALKKDPLTYTTTGTSYENKENLSKQFWQQISKYEGTRLGRQEIEGIIIDDAEGALWKRDAMIEAYRVREHPELVRIVVAVDPPASSTEESAEAGIVVTGKGVDGHGYTLADYSRRGSPREWATAAITAYHLFRADRIVGEVNQGGDMVEEVLRNVDPNVSYKAVRAMRGKQLRAEPVAALYERGLVHHVGAFAELEDQMTNWVPGEKSPDRLDALVWGYTELDLSDGGDIPFAMGSASPQVEVLPATHESEDEALMRRQAQLASVLRQVRGYGGYE